MVYAEETLARFQTITDPWGVSQAQGSVVRALVCLGRVDDAPYPPPSTSVEPTARTASWTRPRT